MARGTTAVRGLKLLLGGAADLGSRAANLLDRCNQETNASTAQVTALVALEEVVGRSRQLQEHVLGAIENWTDIVPEANIQTQIGEITRLAVEKEEQVCQVRLLERQLAENRDKSESVQQSLRDEISRKENVLRETRRKLSDATASLGTLATSSWLEALDTLKPFHRTCSKCGKPLTGGTLGDLLLTDCAECRALDTKLNGREHAVAADAASDHGAARLNRNVRPLNRGSAMSTADSKRIEAGVGSHVAALGRMRYAAADTN